MKTGEAHVWIASLEIPEILRNKLCETLSSEEKERAARFRFPGLQNDFVAARGFMRQVLGAYLKKSPADLRFRYQEHGKPELEEPDGWHFNLSHSYRIAALAVTRCGPVGVDVEWMQRKIEAEEISGRFFAAGETKQLKAYQGDDMRRAFFAIWTRKEAFVKLCGEGLSMGLGQFEVSVSPDEPARLCSVRGDASAADKWRFQTLDLPDGYVGTVAVEAKSCEFLQSWWNANPRSAGL